MGVNHTPGHVGAVKRLIVSHETAEAGHRFAIHRHRFESGPAVLQWSSGFRPPLVFGLLGRHKRQRDSVHVRKTKQCHSG